MGDPFGPFTESLKMAIPLVLRTRALQQEEQQFQQAMAQKKMQLAQEQEMEQQKIAAQEFKAKTDQLTGLLGKAHEADDPEAVNWLAPRVEMVTGVPQPRHQDGSYMVLSAKTLDKLSTDQLAADALRNGDMATVDRILGYKSKIAQAGSTKISNTTNLDVSKKSAEELVTEQAKGLLKERPEIEQAVMGLDNIAQATELLDSGMITGTGAKAITEFGNFLNARLGVKFENDPIANTQAYVALMGKEVGQIIRLFGSGTGLSDADREYAEKIAAGDITLNEKSLRKLLGMAQKAYKFKIDRYNKLAGQVMDKPWSKQLLYDLRVEIPKNGKKGKSKVEDSPPVPNARKAPDGNWYVETAPGQFSRVEE